LSALELVSRDAGRCRGLVQIDQIIQSAMAVSGLTARRAYNWAGSRPARHTGGQARAAAYRDVVFHPHKIADGRGIISPAKYYKRPPMHRTRFFF